MTICLNLADFTDLFLLETLTSLILRFTLSVDGKVSLRLENYLAANRIGLKTLHVMLLPSQSSEFKSTTERFWGSTWFIHFDGPSNYYHSFQTPLSLIMANVVYLIRDTSDITLRNLLKQDLTHSSITL